MSKKTKTASRDWFYLLILAISTFGLMPKIVGVDELYIIRNGENILKYGFTTVDSLTMHNDLPYINQHWLTSVIYYEIDKLNMPIVRLIYFAASCIFLIMVLYFLLKLICKDSFVSFICCIITVILFAMLNMFYPRPMTLTMAMVLWFIYLLELYSKKPLSKYASGMIIISILLINMHASLWWMLCISILPYICDFSQKRFGKSLFCRFKLKYIKLLGIILATGFVNPYGIKAMLFLFESGIDDYTRKFCSEVRPVIFTNYNLKFYCIAVFALFFIIMAFICNRAVGRYIWFSIGGTLMAVFAVRNIGFMVLFVMFNVSYMISHLLGNTKHKFRYDLFAVPVGVLFLLYGMPTDFSITNITFDTIYPSLYDGRVALDEYVTENNIDKSDFNIYSHEAWGSYLEYNYYRPFEDCRNEVLRKSMNRQHDYYIESCDFRSGHTSCEYLLETYDIQAIYVAQYYIDDIISSNPEYFNSHFKLLYSSESDAPDNAVVYVRKDR